MRAAYTSWENGAVLCLNNKVREGQPRVRHPHTPTYMVTCTAARMLDVRKAERGLLGSFHRDSLCNALVKNTLTQEPCKPHTYWNQTQLPKSRIHRHKHARVLQSEHRD